MVRKYLSITIKDDVDRCQEKKTRSVKQKGEIRERERHKSCLPKHEEMKNFSCQTVMRVGS